MRSGCLEWRFPDGIGHVSGRQTDDKRTTKTNNKTDYKEFLIARGELLSRAANDFLNSLLAGAVPEAEAIPSILDRDRTEREVPGGVESEGEERLIKEYNDWAISQGLAGGEYMYELTDPESGEPLALVDLAWPNGLQEGLSKPVALLIDEGPETESAVNKAGYTYFTSVEALKQYIQTEILALESEVIP